MVQYIGLILVKKSNIYCSNKQPMLVQYWSKQPSTISIKLIWPLAYICLTYYTNILDTIPIAPSGTSNSTHIHNTLATRSINKLGPNSVLGRIPRNVSDSETELNREDRVHLIRLRCGHHNALCSTERRYTLNHPTHAHSVT